MANGLKATLRTTLNEGKWNKEPKGGSSDTGDYYGGKYVGTAFGITAEFLTTHTKLNPSVIPSLRRDSAAKIWEATAWQWINGNGINDQDLAELILDWAVQTPNIALDNVLTAVGLDRPRGTYTKKDQKGGKVYFLNDTTISRINQEDPQQLFNRIKQMRLTYINDSGRYKKTKPGVLARANRYSYKVAPPNFLTVNSGKLERNTEGGKKGTNWLLWGGVALIGYQLLKRA